MFSHCGGRRIGRLYASGTGITVVYGICPFCHIGQHQYVTGHFIYVRQPIFHIGRFVYVIGVVKVQLYAIGHEFSSYTKMVIIVYASLHMPKYLVCSLRALRSSVGMAAARPFGCPTSEPC